MSEQQIDLLIGMLIILGIFIMLLLMDLSTRPEDPKRREKR